jgi:hypothetical protein
VLSHRVILAPEARAAGATRRGRHRAGARRGADSAMSAWRGGLGLGRDRSRGGRRLGIEAARCRGGRVPDRLGADLALDLARGASRHVVNWT